jgi:hypothetical protein
MNLSFKDTKFIIEAIDYLLEKYDRHLTEIEDDEDCEDEASDLGNDKMFLESLKIFSIAIAELKKLDDVQFTYNIQN